ncbi:hypothetical protein D8674_022969 [Pyrus ussuriensis x Pyrus communis]|uniref:PIGA GPI anchor biosynthesis domain-containing protein n=1 Tax=Pyrus ussuriensis x Pyrus communis TaxID=2448454 RepID=A0A5N5GR58_9ROSA|nr:hypothetical protein D8674_022969 [Pyrus ussuriensis x Pyrus communis]
MGEWKRHRILMVSDFFYPNFGGVENHSYYLTQCLLKLGHKLPSGLKVYYVPWKPFLMQNTFPTFYGTLPIVRTILIRQKISLVHGLQAFSTLCHGALMHSRTMGYKVVFTDHSLYGFADVGSIHMNKVLQFTLAEVSQAICVSHTSKENTVLRSGLPPEKAMFKPAPERLSSHEIVIGADLPVEVIPEVCRLYPNVCFIVGGDGPKCVRLEEMREKHSLQDRVEMLGAVQLSKAASCGLLTVSPHVGGVPDVLPDDMIVLAKPDPSDMVQAIEKLNVLCLFVCFYMKALYNWHDVPAEDIEEVPDFVLSHDQDEGTSLDNANQRSR